MEVLGIIIYRATNILNGKIYIGKTIGSLERRKRQHRNDAFTNMKQTYFCKAIRKHGWEAFEWDIIEVNIDNETLCEREIHWIKHFKSNTKGYNLTTGGEGMSGWTITEAHRKKLSDAHKGVKLSESHRMSLSKARMGKVFSEETRKKISDSQRGKPRKTTGENHGNSKLTDEDVRQIKTLMINGVSQREIAKLFNVTKTAIGDIQRGKSRLNVLVEDFEPHTKENKGEGNPHAKLSELEVIEIKKLLIKKSLSQSDIAKKYNISKHVISKIKLGKIWNHVKVEGEESLGLSYKKITEEDKLKIEELIEQGLSIRKIALLVGFDKESIRKIKIAIKGEN